MHATILVVLEPQIDFDLLFRLPYFDPSLLHNFDRSSRLLFIVVPLLRPLLFDVLLQVFDSAVNFEGATESQTKEVVARWLGHFKISRAAHKFEIVLRLKQGCAFTRLLTQVWIVEINQGFLSLPQLILVLDMFALRAIDEDEDHWDQDDQSDGFR